MSKKRGIEDEGFTLAPPPDVLPPAEPIAAPQDVPAPTPVPEPIASPLPLVPLDVYCQTCGKRFDQTKGFARWAKIQGLVALTIPEWREQWQKFQNRPV